MFQTKLVKSGPILEYYSYNLPIRSHSGPSAFNEKWKEEFPDEEEEEVENNCFYRSKRNARRIIYCNAWRWFREDGLPYPPFFLTLTFEENIQDIKTANRIFSKFIQRFNYMLTGKKKSYLQYLGVLEFQKRGAIHYHIMLFNLPYIKDKVYTTIRELWNKDWRIKLQKVESTEVLVSYLSKYMTKDYEDQRLAKKKRYFVTKNILRPEILRDTYAVLSLTGKLKGRLVCEREWDTKYVGHMKYERYVLHQEDKIFDLDLDQEAKDAISSVIKE
ncbi:hypothetical protein M0Q50_00115 [bacterium]|jgi:hypothetical protein|nr:hypothetical protein [bacterium]